MLMSKIWLITIICIISLSFLVSCSKNSQEEANIETNIDVQKNTFSEEINTSGDSIPVTAEDGTSVEGSSNIKFKY